MTEWSRNYRRNEWKAEITVGMSEWSRDYVGMSEKQKNVMFCDVQKMTDRPADRQ